MMLNIALRAPTPARPPAPCSSRLSRPLRARAMCCSGLGDAPRNDAAGTQPASSPSDFIFGDSFVIQRHGSAPLSGADAGTALSVVRTQPCLGLQLHSALTGPGALVPYDVTRFSTLVDDTVVEVEVASDGEDGGTYGEFAPSSETGIVWVPRHEEGEGQAAAASGSGRSSPRRTGRIQFTCNVCGSVNVKPVNPRAWASGTVFARCCGCRIVHKLVDHLNLIDEVVYNKKGEGEDGYNAGDVAYNAEDGAYYVHVEVVGEEGGPGGALVPPPPAHGVLLVSDLVVPPHLRQPGDPRHN